MIKFKVIDQLTILILSIDLKLKTCFEIFDFIDNLIFGIFEIKTKLTGSPTDSKRSPSVNYNLINGNKQAYASFVKGYH